MNAEGVDPERGQGVHQREGKGFHCRWVARPFSPSASGYLNLTPVYRVPRQSLMVSGTYLARTTQPPRCLLFFVVIKICLVCTNSQMHIYLGSFGRLRVRARRLVLDHHLELLGSPLRSHHICPARCRPLTSGTKRERVRTDRGKIQKRAFQTHPRPTESTCVGLNMYPVLVSRTARQVTMGTRWTTRTTVG